VTRVFKNTIYKKVCLSKSKVKSIYPICKKMILHILNSVCNEIDWSRMVSTKGNTQERERYYIGVITTIISRLGGTFNTAGSQESVDIQDVTFPGMAPFHIEGKATTSGHFMLNDTMIKSNVHYMLFYVKHKVVTIELGSDIIKRTTEIGSHNIVEGRKPATKEAIMKAFNVLMDEAVYSVQCGVMSLFDFGQMWKQTWKFGKLASRPRPNWSITVPRKPT
jgi:hypothetical protein